MKIVKVKPFGMFKVSDEVLKTIEKHSASLQESKTSFSDVLKKAQKDKFTGKFIGIDPESNNLFNFIPIIDENKFFVSSFPEPIQLYFSLAYFNFQSSIQTRKTIVYKQSQNNELNLVNSYTYNWYLQYKVSTVIFLHSTIEAFINYIMEEDFIYIQEVAGDKSDRFIRQTKEYSKEQTERNINFKEKLKSVVKQITKIDFHKEHQKIYDNLIQLNLLRNDLIHLRSTKQNNIQYFQKVFSELINIDMEPFVKSVEEFINIIRPNFIEYLETKVFDDTAKFDFNFETFGAFKLSIDVFLKILEVKARYIQLNIPKSGDANFTTAVDWIHQNLHIMAERQLIFFPTTEENENMLIIKIIKTDRKMGGD